MPTIARQKLQSQSQSQSQSPDAVRCAKRWCRRFLTIRVVAIYLIVDSSCIYWTGVKIEKFGFETIQALRTAGNYWHEIRM